MFPRRSSLDSLLILFSSQGLCSIPCPFCFLLDLQSLPSDPCSCFAFKISLDSTLHLYYQQDFSRLHAPICPQKLPSTLRFLCSSLKTSRHHASSETLSHLLVSAPSVAVFCAVATEALVTATHVRCHGGPHSTCPPFMP